MGTYFKPLRRKIGVVTLGRTCVVMVGWMRSHERFDFFEVNGSWWRYGSESVIGHIRIIRTDLIIAGSLFDFSSGQVEQISKVRTGANGIRSLDPAKSTNTGRRFDCGPFHISDGMAIGYFQPFRVGVCVVPYWLVTIPLVLISAYLVMSIDRRKQSRESSLRETSHSLGCKRYF